MANDGFLSRHRLLSCRWIQCRRTNAPLLLKICTVYFHVKRHCSGWELSVQFSIYQVSCIRNIIWMRDFTAQEMWFCSVFVNPWRDRAVEAVGHSDVLSGSQWPHFLATCLHKRKGHSNLDIKSLLGPWWHWLWHAYQRTGCDVYAVEFILIRSCRRQWKEQLGCRGVREKVKGKKNLEIWLLSFIRNMQIGACKKGIIVECEFHHQVLPCMQMY